MTINNNIRNTWLHFKKICIHKYWVAKYCFKVGLYWQGLTHDLSKFSCIEFWESVKYYQGTSSPIKECKRKNGYSLAWQHHKGRNPHHYEYWTDNSNGGTICIEMPYNYAVEMICDYLGAARAYLGNKFTYKGEYEWWMNKLNNKHPKIHGKTTKFVTSVLKALADREEQGYYPDMLFNKEFLEYYYKEVKK